MQLFKVRYNFSPVSTYTCLPALHPSEKYRVQTPFVGAQFYFQKLRIRLPSSLPNSGGKIPPSCPSISDGIVDACKSPVIVYMLWLTEIRTWCALGDGREISGAERHLLMPLRFYTYIVSSSISPSHASRSLAPCVDDFPFLSNVQAPTLP